MIAVGFTDTSSQQRRLPSGGLVDRSAPLPFTFDGRAYTGFAGDTLASALMANGVRLLGRSFKYHRPRGLVAAGSEEPNALMELRAGGRREPNIPATVVELFAGLEARSQNRFPSLAFDLIAANGLLGGVFSAGFYYKTFMWPASFWERVYEPLIRRAAGLGRAATAPDPDHYRRGHLHCDVLVVGAGPAGLSAALAAGRAGARVILADEDSRPGGRLLVEREAVDGQPGPDWADTALAELRAMPDVRVLPRTTVFGAYDHGTFGAVERNADHLAAPTPGQQRQTYWRIVARRCVLAAGAIERPLVFPGNDRPGVLLAGAARAYVNRWAAMPGRRAVVVTAGRDGWRTVDDLRAAGIEVAAVVDRDPAAAPRGDMQVFPGGHVVTTRGRLGVQSVEVVDALGQKHRIAADMVAMAGGWSPNVALTAHMGSRPVWDAGLAAFVPGTLPPGMDVAGAAAGRFELEAALTDGTRAGAEAAASMSRPMDSMSWPGSTRPSMPPPVSDDAASIQGVPAQRPSSVNHVDARGKPGHDERAASPLWLMPRGPGKAFVDYQHDVTASDVALAHREGFRSVEHLKRYTTLGMATDQGRLGNVNGLALMAELTGAGIAETGTTMFRPPYAPITIGALAGHSVGRDFRPTRLTPAHAWAEGQGAEFMEAGAWIRASHFPLPGEDWLAACDREVTATRTTAGLCDVSTLGKIELTGPDVGVFLDRLYTGTFSTLAPGRIRYGLMLREDGFVMDDGTTARLEPERWIMTTTTAQAAPVLAHMEFCHQVLWPGLDVQFCTVTDQWAQFSLAGPRARDVLARVVEGDVSDTALPYMACAVLRACGVRARLFRVSFSGEMAFELAVPARHGDALARAIMQAGAPLGLVPNGTEALGAMRIEKGHPAGPELNGQTTGRDLGMSRIMSSKKDYIGRAMAARPALIANDRPVLVGLRPASPAERVRAGSHLLEPGGPATVERDLGWVTSGAHSPTLGWIALGMLRGGASRMGTQVRVYDPIRGGDGLVEVVPPCFVDPEGVRLRG